MCVYISVIGVMEKHQKGNACVTTMFSLFRFEFLVLRSHVESKDREQHSLVSQYLWSPYFVPGPVLRQVI